jgi:hypothetical protein
MIVILASPWDPTPGACVARWASRDVGVLTPRDLSLAGWRQRLHGDASDAVVVGGKVVLQKEITGMLTLLPCVSEHDLAHIAPQDLSYVAAEMTAFLVFWLSRLKCPVLNRPTPACLSGPNWPREKWVRVAADAGIPVESVRRRAEIGISKIADTAAHVSVTIVGDRVFGEVDPVLHTWARTIAMAASVDLLELRFSGPGPDARFTGANSFPDLSNGALADAVLGYLRASPPVAR